MKQRARAAWANADFEMLSRAAYFKRLVEDVRRTKAGDRVAVISMVIDRSQPLIGDLLQALKAAAKRGATVHLMVDSYMFLIKDPSKLPGPLWYKPELERRLRGKFQATATFLKGLADGGVHCTVTNVPDRRFRIPQSGRSHLKAAVINDTAYMGGCNLTSPREVDVMLRWQDAASADWLYKLLMGVAQAGHVRRNLQDSDRQYAFDNQTTLLVDAGVPKQSIIFDTALQMIENARDWIVLTSQYFPPGASTKALVHAINRGVEVRFIYSHPSMHGPVEGTVHKVAQWRAKHRLPVELFTHRLPRHLPLHAKLLATEQGAMIGSHNYAQLGVDFGTAEIALCRNDPTFAKRAVAFIEGQLK